MSRKPRFTQYEMNRYVEVQKLNSKYPASPNYEPWKDKDIAPWINQRKKDGKNGLTDEQKRLIREDELVTAGKPLDEDDNAVFYWKLYNKANMEAWENGTKPIPGQAFGVYVGSDTNLNETNMCDECCARICPVPS